jgi:TetR/AcrR family transcriptional regulator, regulator of autoinduction and epiphytic fitness
MVDAVARSIATGEEDPRIERSRRVILQAVLDELGAVGYGALPIESVAARAGVGKSTIYRHWGGKLALVEDAFRTLKASVQLSASGCLRDRVVDLLTQVAALIEASTYSACMPALIEAAERDPQVRDFHVRFSTERRAVLVDLLAAAVDDGELPPDADPELLADALVGSIVLRRLMLHQPLDPAQVPRLVDQLLPRPPKPRRASSSGAKRGAPAG